MLLPYTALAYYGPACAAMIVQAEGTAEIAARREIRPSITVQGTGTAEMRPYRGRRAALEAGGLGTLQMRPARRLRAALTVAVNELSQDDVAGALLTARIEGDYTFRDVMRLMAATLAGKVSGAETATVTFRGITDTKDRVISVTDVDGNRTAVTLDPS